MNFTKPQLFVQVQDIEPLKHYIRRYIPLVYHPLQGFEVVRKQRKTACDTELYLMKLHLEHHALALLDFAHLLNSHQNPYLESTIKLVKHRIYPEVMGFHRICGHLIYKGVITCFLFFCGSMDKAFCNKISCCPQKAYRCQAYVKLGFLSTVSSSHINASVSLRFIVMISKLP